MVRSGRTSRKALAHTVEVLRQHGMNAVALTPAQMAAFSAVMQPAVREEFLKASGELGAKLLKEVQSM